MTDYTKWKVSDLKAELKKRGLSQTGIKSLLVSRLEEAESGAITQNDSTDSDDGPAIARSPEIASPVSPPDPALDAAQHGELPQLIVPDTNNTAQEIASASSKGAIDKSRSVSPEEAPDQTTPTTPKESTDQDSSTPSKETAPDSPKEIITEATETAESANIVDRADELRSELSTNDETSEDRQKRKRSSHSPSLSVPDISQKRPRTSDKKPIDNCDENWESKPTQGDDNTKEITQSEPEVKDPGSSTAIEVGYESNNGRETIESESKGYEATDLELQNANEVVISHKQELATTSEPTETPTTKSHRDSRFKGIFNGAENSNEVDIAYDYPEPERAVSPAIHPATRALYIRDMQRPLNPQQFRSHLSALAAPPGQSPNPDLILSFYLDPIRTHAFISFSSIYAASRVRIALHSRVWPEERNRKPLWVDFVPEEKLEDWITHEQESNTGGRSMAKKWEVYYDVNEDRQVTATLQEASNAPLPAQVNLSSTTSQISSNHVPLGPRTSIDGVPSGPRVHVSIPQSAFADVAGSKLNELFNATTIKPVLYWKPVSKDLANKRLDCLEDSYSAEVKAGGRVMGDPHRYTFEEGDLLVDRGVELVPGLRPPPGYRAPRPGGDRGGFCGGMGGWGRGSAGRFRGRGGVGVYRGNFHDKYGYGNDSRGPRDYRRY